MTNPPYNRDITLELCKIHFTGLDLNKNCVYCISDKRKSIADSACTSLAAIADIIERPNAYDDQTKVELIKTILKLSSEELVNIAITQ